MNPNDEIRMQILRYFYDRNNCATSRFGKKGSALKISVAKSELKSRNGLTQAQVMSNMTYLIDQGWVNTFDVEKTITVKGGTVPSKVTWYEIAALGIDKIEGSSEFQPPERYPGINITATGGNVITLGDGNVVNAQFSTLHNQLTELKEAVVASPLSETEKLGLAVDIESIKDQLAKEHPNKTIIGHLWTGITSVCKLAELADLVVKVQPYIQALLPS
jgi:hypothetical protein